MRVARGKAVARARRFWLWLLKYRWESRPLLMKAISSHAPTATVKLLRNPKAVARFVAEVMRDNEARLRSSATRRYL
jgi:ribosomal protein L22